MKIKIIHGAKGFTLIELMITIAILAILGAVGIPAYERYKLKGYRMDAISYLTRAAVLEENWMAEKGTYTPILTNLGGSITEHEHYNIAINVSGSGSTFSITATTKGAQVSDTDCASFTIDSIGRKLATKNDASDNSRRCWGR